MYKHLLVLNIVFQSLIFLRHGAYFESQPLIIFSKAGEQGVHLLELRQAGLTIAALLKLGVLLLQLLDAFFE